jgi:predicted aspartyl protease
MTVNALDLRRIDGMEAQLADGSTVLLDVYAALIEWQDYEVEVLVMATGDRPLLGTGLLAGWEFRAQFIEGGLVTVSAID